MYLSLYRRYRPQTFHDVVGQEPILAVLSRAVQNNSVGHAYLFSGPRGCGKTTLARLFAKAVNCPNLTPSGEPCNDCEVCRSITDGDSMDVIEIDGASNNGVEEIRTLRDHVGLASFECKYKVYIIDEVHSLSSAAFNALLKTLEEPPAGIIFILATTEPHKVPVTIKSRCQHMPFHGLSQNQIVQRLKFVLTQENLESDEEALWEISRASDGGMRDALSLLEQSLAKGEPTISLSTVESLLGGGSSFQMRRWLSDISTTPEQSLPKLLDIFLTGASPERILNSLFTLTRNLWSAKTWGPKTLQSLSLSSEEQNWLTNEINNYQTQDLEKMMMALSAIIIQTKRGGMSNDVLAGLITYACLKGNKSLPTEKPENIKSPQLIPKKTDPIPTSPTQEPPIPQETPPNYAEPTLQDMEELDDMLLQPTDIPTQEPIVSTTPTTQPEILPKIDYENTPLLGDKNSQFTQLLWQNLNEYPSIVTALFLAEVYLDGNKLTLNFPLHRKLAFESLCLERTMNNCYHLLKPLFDIETIQVSCGDETMTFNDFIDLKAQPLQQEPSSDATLKNSKRHKAPKVSPDNLEEFTFSKKSNPNGDPGNETGATEKSHPNSLSVENMISQLGEAELLFYKHQDLILDDEEEMQQDF